MGCDIAGALQSGGDDTVTVRYDGADWREEHYRKARYGGPDVGTGPGWYAMKGTNEV